MAEQRSDRFLDELARALAAPMPRRKALGVLGTAFTTFALGRRGGPRAGRGRAACQGAVYCPSIAPCLCDDEFHICCREDEVCCPGEHGGCCPKNYACSGKFSTVTGTQLCEACARGDTPCNGECCHPWEDCTPDGCKMKRCTGGGELCGSHCCRKDQYCCSRQQSLCCNDNVTCCGPSGRRFCCGPGQECRISRPWKPGKPLPPLICCPKARACVGHCCQPDEECVKFANGTPILCCRKEAVCKGGEACCGQGHCCEGRYCCASWEICVKGGDGCKACKEPLKRCRNRCVDLRRDKANCGRCGNGCPGDKVCEAGKCRCPSGRTECGSQCCRGGERCQFVERLGRRACVLPAPPRR